jgi:hypothetical protein
VDKSGKSKNFLIYGSFLEKMNFQCGEKSIFTGIYPDGMPSITHSYPQLMALIHSLIGFIHRFV